MTNECEERICLALEDLVLLYKESLTINQKTLEFLIETREQQERNEREKKQYKREKGI